MLLVSFAGFIGSGSKEKSSFRKEFLEKALPPLSKRKVELVWAIRLLLLLSCKQAKSK